MAALASIEKLVERMRNNPKAVRYAELTRLLRHLGFERRKGQGSHERWDSADGKRYVMVVRPHGGRSHCHPADVADVLVAYEEGGDLGRQA